MALDPVDHDADDVAGAPRPRDRERPGRGFLLGSVYALVIAMGQVVLPLLAMLGLADVAFSLRNRFGPGAGPKPPSI